MNFRQKLVIIIMDILILVELTFCVYLSSGNPEYQAAIFVRTYLPALIVTLVLARILFKRWGTTEPAGEEAGRLRQ